MMNEAKVNTVIAALNYNWRQFTMADFVRHVEGYRGRPINIIEAPGLKLPGFVLRLYDEDYVVVNASVHPVARMHYKLHEIGHILLNHMVHADYVSAEDIQEIILSVSLFRANHQFLPEYVPGQEREAEFFVNRIQDFIFHHRREQELMLTEEEEDAHYPPLSNDYLKIGNDT